LTLHDEPVSLPTVLAPDLEPAELSRGCVVYSVLDALLATKFDALEEVESKLEALADTWTGKGAGRAPRHTLQGAGARLAAMRRSARTQQAVFERAGAEIVVLPGFGSDDVPYFQRLDEQADRLLAAVDAAANAMGMLLDLQLNERAYLVSVVATIFVPLTSVTGFFGMNFGWMIDQIRTPAAFWVLGILIPIAVPALTWRVVARWLLMGDDDKPRRR
jgi:magnesium transporter